MSKAVSNHDELARYERQIVSGALGLDGQRSLMAGRAPDECR